MHSLSSSRQDTQDSSWPPKTCSSNSLPLTLSPFPFPLFLYWRSPLPFCLLFLFPSSSISWAMLAVNISFCNLDFISCHVFDIRSGHLHFQGQNFLYFFPFVCSIFFSYTLFFGFVCFQCFPCYYFCSCSTDFSLIRESNSLSDYRPVRLLSLEPRILSSLYHFISQVAIP